MDGDDHSIDDEEEVAAQAGGQEGVAQAEEPQAVDSERGYQALLAKQEARIKELEGVKSCGSRSLRARRPPSWTSEASTRLRSPT